MFVLQFGGSAAWFLVANGFEAAGKPVFTAVIHRIQIQLLLGGDILGPLPGGEIQDGLRAIPLTPVVAVLHQFL